MKDRPTLPDMMHQFREFPDPALPPNNLGTCIRMIVVQIPLINPPITGAEI